MLAVLHPYVLDYRKGFFQNLNDHVPLDIFCYESPSEVKKLNHNTSNVKVNYIKSISCKGFVLYNPFAFLNKKYDCLILMLSLGHITTLLILLTKPIHKKKIILWGHGISVKRFLEEEKRPSFILGLMIKMADTLWFYTENELNIWKNKFPEIKAVSLNNTLSAIDTIGIYKNTSYIDALKAKYKISHEKIIIYCARFIPERRIDLLEKVINKVNPKKIGFIIIGDGVVKPDFSKYENVYDFGEVYDIFIKNELFAIADIYFQPAWVGLSIVEAMAYSKPIFTFNRSKTILQCVEFYYIKEGLNGRLFDDVDNLVLELEAISKSEICELGINAKKYFVDNLNMPNMVNNALSTLSMSNFFCKYNKVKILALWAPLADYSVASLKFLTNSYDVDLMLIYQKSEGNAPYTGFDLSFSTLSVQVNENNTKFIHDKCLEFRPDVILMSSWNYPKYMSISKECKKKSTYIVSTFDGQWAGTLKQYLGIITSFFFLKPIINNFFVAGDRQATFARKLGYKNPFIGYYSANTINKNFETTQKRENKFVFVGRLVKQKNIETLVKSYQQYRNSVDDPWDLIICGKGPLEYLCKDIPGIILMNFVQPDSLKLIMLTSKCLLLLSLYEPWGLVIHEATLAGLVVISSYQAGATTAFVRDGQNGYVVNPDVDSVAISMKKVSMMSDEKLADMEKVSRTLGKLWTTQRWSEYVYKNICNKEV